MMESQIVQLEQRLKRRDHELSVALEEGRSNSKLELARLHAIHEQVQLENTNNYDTYILCT